jgi:tryptophan synthase alpha subunit
MADGVIVGSHLVAWLANNWQDGAGKQHLVQMIAEFKAALD